MNVGILILSQKSLKLSLHLISFGFLLFQLGVFATLVSKPLIQSSASSVMLIPYNVFFISIIVFFIFEWFFFMVSISLLRISLSSSVLPLSSLRILVTSILDSASGRLLVST